MTSDAGTTPPDEHEPDGEPSTPRRQLDRAVVLLRRVLVPLALLYAWVQLVRWCRWLLAEDSIGGDYVLGFIVTAAVLVAVTVFIAVGFRSERVRRATLPVELALLVGAAVLLAGARGPHIDTDSDVFAVGLLFASGTLVLLSFLSVLLDGRASRSSWMVGTSLVLALFGATLPTALGWFDDGEVIAPVDLVSGSYQLMSAFDEHGNSRLGYDAIGPDEYEPGRRDRAALLADADGDVFLDVTLQANLRGRYVAEVRRGSCDRAGASVARVTGTWNPSLDRAARHELPLRLDTIGASDELHVRYGTGRPLDDVRCVELLDSSRVVLARSGAAEFHRRCVRVSDPRSRAALTPESLQDATCARDMQRLVDLAASNAYATRDGATRLVRCLAADGVTVEPQAVAGVWLVRVPDEAVTSTCLADPALSAGSYPADPSMLGPVASTAEPVGTYGVDPALEGSPRPAVVVPANAG